MNELIIEQNKRNIRINLIKLENLIQCQWLSTVDTYNINIAREKSSCIHNVHVVCVHNKTKKDQDILIEYRLTW